MSNVKRPTCGKKGESTLKRILHYVKRYPLSFACSLIFAAISVAVVIYLILVLMLRAVSKEDVMLMPKGEKIAKILHF